jgi:tryptophan synthase alpha subunit
MTLTFAQAVAEAKTMNWSDTTVSVGFMVSQPNQADEIIHFDRSGNAIGHEVDGYYFPYTS